MPHHSIPWPVDYLLEALAQADRGALITVTLAVVVSYAWLVSSLLGRGQD